MKAIVVKATAVLVVMLCTPVGIAAILSAVMFGLRQFVSGWIPSRWLSDNAADWLFGLGMEGDAGNYLGFMVSALAAAGCWSAVQWGMSRLASSRRSESTER